MLESGQRPCRPRTLFAEHIKSDAMRGRTGFRGFGPNPALRGGGYSSAQRRYGQSCPENAPRIFGVEQPAHPRGRKAKRWAANVDAWTGGWSIPQGRDTQINGVVSTPAISGRPLQMC